MPFGHALAGRERVAFAEALGGDFVGLSGGSALHALAVVRMQDPWAERRLPLVVRRLDALPAHARRLVEHLMA